MDRYSKQILALRDELLKSIKTILTNNNLDEISISDSADKTYVVWWDNEGFIYEGQAINVKLKNNDLSIIVDSQELIEEQELFEGSDAFENPICLNSIRDNIIEALSEVHGNICDECGKSVSEENCTGEDAKHFICNECQHNNQI